MNMTPIYAMAAKANRRSTGFATIEFPENFPAAHIPPAAEELHLVPAAFTLPRPYLRTGFAFRVKGNRQFAIPVYVRKSRRV